MDRTVLFGQEVRRSNHKKDQIPILVKFLPAFCSLRYVIGRLQNVMGASEEHGRGFKKKPSVVFRRVPNLKYSLVRAKLPRIWT